MKDKAAKIAVLSGKGGTGKTLVSVNLASVAEESIYIDCDVEGPNGHLFFKPELVYEKNVKTKIPSINDNLCTGCRTCVDFCKFNAVAFIQGKPYVFEEICHSCGGCMLLCPKKAISEKEKIIGKVQRGVSYNVTVNTGILKTGEASGTPIIKRLLNESISDKELPTFIDCPPGSACIVMDSIRDADYCILVAEPTVFGVHNLNMVYDLVKLFDKPHGVVLNKCLDGRNLAEKFCVEKNISVLARIPFDTDLAALNSDAKIVVRENEHFQALFAALLETVMKEARSETTFNTQR